MRTTRPFHPLTPCESRIMCDFTVCRKSNGGTAHHFIDHKWFVQDIGMRWSDDEAPSSNIRRRKFTRVRRLNEDLIHRVFRDVTREVCSCALKLMVVSPPPVLHTSHHARGRMKPILSLFTDTYNYQLQCFILRLCEGTARNRVYMVVGVPISLVYVQLRVFAKTMLVSSPWHWTASIRKSV